MEKSDPSTTEVMGARAFHSEGAAILGLGLVLYEPAREYSIGVSNPEGVSTTLTTCSIGHEPVRFTKEGKTPSRAKACITLLVTAAVLKGQV